MDGTAFQDAGLISVGPAPSESAYPPLLFIHGAFSGAWIWQEAFLPWFAEQGFSCHAVNLPGRKGHPSYDRLHDFGLNDFTAAAVSAIDALKRAAPEAKPETKPGTKREIKPVLVGHSMGGLIAMRAALARDVAGAVLLAPVPPTGLAAPAITLALTRPMLSFEVLRVQTLGESAASLAHLHEALFADHAEREVTRRLMPKFQMESRRAVAEMHVPAVPPVMGFWGKPLCVMAGEQDNLIPPAHVRGAAMMLGGRAEVIDDAGHGMMLERGAPKIAARISAWLAEAFGA